MGKIVMPKNSASKEETEESIRIYYEAQDWLSNADFIDIYRREVGIVCNDTDSSAYTKKGQIGAYYGFIEWQNIRSKTSPRRITPRGRIFWEHVKANDTEAMQEDIIQSLEKVVFGRNNYSCPSSDSDIEPPCLFIRAALDLGYLSNEEFAYLIYLLADKAVHYTDAIQQVADSRSSGNGIKLPDEANKYADVKPIIILESVISAASCHLYL